MPRKTKKASVKNEPLFRHWIEVRDLKEGSVRQLSVKTLIRICLARREQNLSIRGRRYSRSSTAPKLLRRRTSTIWLLNCARRILTMRMSVRCIGNEIPRPKSGGHRP